FISVADPLNDEPMAVLDYTEQDLIDRGVIERKETVIDWEAINGEWYYGFADENGYQFYRLAFDMKTAAMNFDYGFFESEYVNRYAGSFTIDPVSQEITAVLHDSSVMHTDPDITLKFRLASSENSDGAVLVWKMTSCDVEKYRHLIGTSIEFSKNMPSIIELSAVSDGDFKIYTIPQDGDNSLVLKIPKSWYWKTGDFVEDYDGSPAFPTVKRVAYRKTTQTLQEFTDELRATEPGYTQYDMDSPIKGETDAGHTYVGYYGDGEQIKGLHYRRYLFYITTDADAYILEVWQYLDIDGEDFVEEILNQVRKSFYVNVGELPGTSDSDVTPPEKITVQLPEDFVFPITDGSTSTTNLDKAVRNAILGGEQTIAHTKTYTSFQNLLNGKCELIFTTPLSDSQLQTMQERDFRHEAEPVAGEGFVFVVNKDNPVDTLTIEQIKDIYSGKITNWKEVGGNDAEIIAYQRNADSGSQNYMISFMGDTPLMKPVTDQIPASMSGILDVIANYDNGIDAIGYSVYAYSDGMYENISEIKYIKVNGVEPSLTTLADGSYPLLGYNYAVFSADEPEDSNVRTLVKWIQSDEGQQMIADAGFIPYRRVEGLTLPESTTKMLYTAVGTSGVMKPDEMADYYFECNSVPESFTAEGLNEAIAAFIADAEAELAALDKEEMKSFVKSRFQWGFASEDVVIRKTLINGYLSVVVGLRYNEGAQDSPDYYYDVRTAVFDVYTGKRLELSDLFFEELDFTAILNQHLANEAVASYSSMSHITHAMLHDFTGLYEGEFTFTADSIIFKRNTCFADGVVLSLDGMLEHMVTSVPRDMAGYADADTPVYRKIRYGTTSEYAEEKNGITIWYLDKENNSLSEDVCDKINTFIDSLYNVYFTPEKLLESARAIDPGFDKVTIGPFPDFQVSLYGNRYIEIRGANLAFPQKTETGIFDINFTVIQDHHNSAYFAYYFNALTGDELIIGDLFKEGWESEAVYSVYDETYKQRDSGTWTAYTEAFDVKNCRILNVSDYVNAPYNKGDLSDLEMPVTVYIITDNGDKVAVSVPREYIK
ncbi:MAG: substrate-binding domain-containing protein, partial [Oscillospiraceae bacterium]|nr:substrate-binding domain-containing protein [Oscillospiraceae bacterium]